MGKYSHKLKFKSSVIFLCSYPNKCQSHQKLQHLMTEKDEDEVTDIFYPERVSQVNIK